MRDTITAGDTLDFVTSVPDYPASAGYSLKYRLIPRTAGPTPIDITAASSGDDYRVSEVPSVTASWTAGDYTWAAWVEKTGERHSVETGLCTIQPNPGTATVYDGRSDAERALDDAKMAYANFQGTGGRVKRYAIAGREMEFDSAADILKLINFWQTEVTRERAANAAALGRPNPRRILLRMSNA